MKRFLASSILGLLRSARRWIAIRRGLDFTDFYFMWGLFGGMGAAAAAMARWIPEHPGFPNDHPEWMPICEAIWATYLVGPFIITRSVVTAKWAYAEFVSVEAAAEKKPETIVSAPLP